VSTGAAGAVEVVRAGALTTVQDQGRPGLAHLGVPRSGALDRAAAAGANAAVGNDPRAAVLETTVTGVALRAVGPCVMAVTGASAPVSVDGLPVGMGPALTVPDGAVLDVATARAGVRSYVAVAGGIDVPEVLGSRSTDLLSGLGPVRLRDGDRLPIGGHRDGDRPGLVVAAPATMASGLTGALLELTVRLGPRHDWFTPAALATLLRAEYTVSLVSNRVALRLAGPPLERAVADELRSEGVVLGAVQVPADGQPLIFLADHPTTGGYPVVAVVDDAEVDRCAQARPGTAIRFRLR
jgi:biotin-dependent carboxylase-like uncharacterized protein